ncbi:hypothetical protein QTH90_30685 [Variovorax sp. J2P1-59]|uniref:hypothetical protein n=1 Tax=Variovorax flavidus TaxID=3053501 RepID=UPI0025772AE6|nr:hypothetical protein [Variovorax sp. J2P1-59]MDM0078808.1 hypothetical protein [Variovorax sp. J2P1-59]
MTTSSPTRAAAVPTAVSLAVKLCGTDQSDATGRVLSAGPLSVELESGNLRYLCVGGVEVLRGLAFLVRDENWGTSVPKLADLVVEQRPDSFSVSYRAEYRGAGSQLLCLDARIEGHSDGSLEFNATATPATDFLTARTGFVVLHPLKGIVGHALEVEHVDGTLRALTFPALVDPVQPLLNLRSLTHEVMPGLKAVVRMEGDTFEMEDHRNWTDASFKTYVRPLALPWPYVLKAGKAVRQSVRLNLLGTVPKSAKGSAARTVSITLGRQTSVHMPAIGLGMPAQEIEASLAAVRQLQYAAPRLLICEFDARKKHGPDLLDSYRRLCELTGAECELEVVVESLDGFRAELAKLASMARESGLALSALAVCPVGDLKSVLPGSQRPPAPPLAQLYDAARAAFPGVRLGGGMFSFFAELNRKRPPADLLDFVHNSTCPTVHAADDRSVMETHEALSHQVKTARSFIGDTAYRIGPSSIGCRDNPYGKTFTPNPDNERLCLANADPRQRGLFGAAWTLSYVASLAATGVETVCFGAPTGPLGIIHRPGDRPVPYFDALGCPAVYPAYHVVAGLTRAAGANLVAAASSDDARVRCLAYRAAGSTLLWIANPTAIDQTVHVVHDGAAAFGIVLDETSFGFATSDPASFASDTGPLALDALTLRAYAVVLACIADR